MAIADGERIAIEFSDELLGIGNAVNAFTVTIQQYDMVPGGSLVSETRAVTSAELDSGDASILYLNFASGNVNSIRNAVGNVTVSYDATKGRLYGEGGPVQSFTMTFAPVDLEPKDNPLTREHITMGFSATSNLIRIYYHDSKTDEHIEMSVSALGTLTYIGDL